jgi:hypothetical protein
MTALEKALQTNSTPLLLFAALRDFSGENISFLDHVRDWKAKWVPAASRHSLLKKQKAEPSTNDMVRQRQFNVAVQIYASFVDVHHSEFPVNLSFPHRKELEGIFGAAASRICTQIQRDSVTPFDDRWSSTGTDDPGDRPPNGMSVASTCVNNSTDTILPRADMSNTKHQSSFRLNELHVNLPQNTPIPERFGPEVFDTAEESIKYMVLTNTWAKFVNAGYASSQQEPGLLDNIKEGLSAWLDRFVYQRFG